MKIHDRDGNVIATSNPPESRIFDGMVIHGALLAGFELEGISFDGSDLRGSDYTGANLDGADFTGATYDALTIFPEGFDPALRGVLLVGTPAPPIRHD